MRGWSTSYPRGAVLRRVAADVASRPPSSRFSDRVELGAGAVVVDRRADARPAAARSAS